MSQFGDDYTIHLKTLNSILPQTTQGRGIGLAGAAAFSSDVSQYHSWSYTEIAPTI